jgi:hypothetical protein
MKVIETPAHVAALAHTLNCLRILAMCMPLTFGHGGVRTITSSQSHQSGKYGMRRQRKQLMSGH